MKIVIVIPTFNRNRLLLKLLGQINNQRVESDINIEIVVVNDGSSDGTSTFIYKQFPNTHIVEGTGNWWYTKSMNEGFKYAEKLNPDYILTLNDDIEIDKSYLDTLLKAANKVDKGSIIGSISLTIDKPHKIFFSGVSETNFNTYSSTKYHALFSEINLEDLSGLHVTTQLPGRGMLIPFSVLRKLNYFDENFIQYGSDSDFCFTAIENGINIYISWDAKIYSHWKETGKGSPFLNENILRYTRNVFFNKYSARYIGNSFRMIYKHYNRKKLPIFLIKTIVSKYTAFFNQKYL